LWRRLLGRRLLRRRLGLGRWLGLLRLWLGGIFGVRRTRLLRRLRLLRICPGLRRAGVRSSSVCRAGLHHGSLRQAGLHDPGLLHSGLPHSAGSRSRSRGEHSPGNAGLDEACVCLRSHYDLHRAALHHLSQTIGTAGFCRHLRPSSAHAGLDAAARAAIESDLQLDDSPQHDWLFGQHPVGGEGVVQGVFLPCPPLKTEAGTRHGVAAGGYLSIDYPGLNLLGSARHLRISPARGG